MIPTVQVPTPQPVLLLPFKAESRASQGSPNLRLSDHPFRLATSPEAARKAYLEKRDEWASLDLHPDTRLRQDWVDEEYMRQHIKDAGIRISNSAEPATVARLRTSLTRAGVKATEIRDSVGTSLAGFLKLNRRLPLWAALALVLEATGRFIRDSQSGRTPTRNGVTIAARRLS